MRILFVASRNSGSFVPFVREQAEALRRAGVDCRMFGVTGRGLKGYLGNLRNLKKEIRMFRPDVIHAHYGLCGLLACLQREVPVVVTYHGSDINVPSVMRFSRIAMKLAKFNVFVSKKTMALSLKMKNSALIPCGIDLEDYPEMKKADARKALNLDLDRRFVLFAGSFSNPVKCPELARETMALLPEAQLLELKGYDRKGVATVMAAADALLMTSYSEGSPQVVKEALASGLPVVSVDVGAVGEMIGGLPGCEICVRTPECLAAALHQAFETPSFREHGRARLIELGLTNDVIAKRLVGIYETIAK